MSEEVLDSASFNKNYRILKETADWLSKQEEPDIDQLVPKVERAMQAYRIRKDRLDRVKETLGQHGLRLLAQSIASAYLLCEQINRRGLRFAANGCTQEDSIEANRTLNTQTRAISVLGGLVLELLKYGQPATQTVVYKHVSIEAGAQAMLGPAQPRRSAVRDGKGRVTGRNER